MMHPNWLLIGAVLSLWGPLSLQAPHPAERFAGSIDRAVHAVGWEQIRLALVCGEGDPAATECR